MKNVLVTGGLGLLGKHLINFLDKKNLKYLCLISLNTKEKGF